MGSPAAFIRGRVLDPQERPVAEATVELLDAGGKVLAQTLSDGEGWFTLPGEPPPGSRVRIRSEGFLTVQLSAAILAREPRDLSLTIAGIAETVGGDRDEARAESLRYPAVGLAGRARGHGGAGDRDRSRRARGPAGGAGPEDDARRRRPRYFPSVEGTFEKQLAAKRSPEAASRWHFLMNMTEESFRELVSKHVPSASLPTR